jgi:hypothetical protein
VTVTERGAGFQYPGLLVLDPDTNYVAICYGHGRWNSDTGPLAPVPIAEIGGDLAPLAEIGLRIQFEGAKQISIRHSEDQSSPLAAPPEPKGRKIRVQLGEASVTATLLEDQSPRAAEAFAKLLPLKGTGSNTHSSGPLTRFWNPDGGPGGEIILKDDNIEEGQVLLYPSYLYYLTKPGVRGIRVAREAAMMRGAAAGGGNLKLIPIARFDGDWSSFYDEAERIAVEGSKPMRFELID